jgi:hypothetical protein
MKKTCALSLCMSWIVTIDMVGWNIVVSNQTNKIITCHIIPSIDIGKYVLGRNFKRPGTSIPPYESFAIQIPVWQENLNPYTIIGKQEGQSSMRWEAVLKANTMLKFSSVQEAHEIGLYYSHTHNSWDLLKKEENLYE